MDWSDYYQMYAHQDFEGDFHGCLKLFSFQVKNYYNNLDEEFLNFYFLPIEIIELEKYTGE